MRMEEEEGKFDLGWGPKISSGISDGETPVDNPPYGPRQHGHVAGLNVTRAPLGRDFLTERLGTGVVTPVTNMVKGQMTTHVANPLPLGDEK
ncbi:hypothetical protein Syun_019033 [Stephania yunnanensis]|uniref:Uncharacterized protein n=1 Tax=Stephania yunnanensis TaxID=152371 RepID=A0AAP0ITD6_9MAGN